jgi:hypothetical protein
MANIPSAAGRESVTSPLERFLFFPPGVGTFSEAPQTAQRVLPSAFFDPQVAQIEGFGASCSAFFAMEYLLIVSLRSWHYTSTYE